METSEPKLLTSEMGVGDSCTLAEMIEANAENDSLIEWLASADVGASYDDLVTVTRVS